MDSQFDLVIRGGTIVDGSGLEIYEADVGVTGGVIREIGRLSVGAHEIDARGLLVTPGFVDIHTHYDGQATWDNRLSPSSNHGVTTVVAGNCGVGFAPCRPADRQALVRLMEGVEDVPEVVMAEGLPWNWESFPQYLDVLSSRRFDIDLAVYIPHSPVRVFTMGERGVNREPATQDDIARMRIIVAEGVRAGALGVSTSRFLEHRTRAGEQAPSIHSEEAELHGLAGGLRDAGRGVFQIVPHLHGNPHDEFALMRRLVESSGRPLSFSLVQTGLAPEGWRVYLDCLANMQPDAAPMTGQVFPRPIGLLYGLDLSFHPFCLNPSYQAVAHLPLAERVQAMRNAALRDRILAEVPESSNPFHHVIVGALPKLSPLGDPPIYDPKPEQALAARAAAKGISIKELAYDLLLEQGGQAVLYWPSTNFLQGDLNSTREMITHPGTVIGLGDGGAHYGMVCDSSFPTYVLAHWTRDAPIGERIELSRAVAELTRRSARAVGLQDRGLIAPGMKADMNVIDYDRLHLHAPRPIYDLPAGGRRMTQAADGYVATIVSGYVTYQNGAATDELPGRLVRHH